MKTTRAKTFDYSIEYCHIYTNETVNGEHELSVNKLKHVVADMERGDKTYNLCVMVDDYTFPEESFDYDSFYQWLHTMDAVPHVCIRETNLIPCAEEVLEHIEDTKHEKKLRNYITRKRYPCSLFIAAWYLSRLGKLQTMAHDPIHVSDRLINILPTRFKPFEDEAIKIINATKFRSAASAIDNIYV